MFRRQSNDLSNSLIIGCVAGLTVLSATYSGTENFSLSVMTGVVSSLLTHTFMRDEKSVETSKKVTESKCPFQKNYMKDHGLFGEKSITWKVSTDPSVLIAINASALLQMLHPDVIRIIEKTGKFYQDPIGRGERTVMYGRSITFGDTQTAQTATDAFNRLHQSLKAKNPYTNQWYSSNEPALLLWVHNSLNWIMLRAFKHYGPALTLEEENQFIVEQNVTARAINIPEEMLPTNLNDLNSYMEKMTDQLALTKDSLHFRNFFVNDKRLSCSLRASLDYIFVHAGTYLLSPLHRDLFGLEKSCLKDSAIEAIANVIVKVMRIIFPAKKSIENTREELTKLSFGKR